LAAEHRTIAESRFNPQAAIGSVPEAVWTFHIGGYQKIVVALNETIRLMAEIDEVIDQHGGWPAPSQPASRREIMVDNRRAAARDRGRITLFSGKARPRWSFISCESWLSNSLKRLVFFMGCVLPADLELGLVMRRCYLQ